MRDPRQQHLGMSPRDRSALQGAIPALHGWYRARGRDLPWRHSADPYAIWVSEVMLQQTRVTAVIPYYRRWLERFPTVEALAAAPLDEVLRLWEGLGYYSRARNLHRAARTVAETYSGRVPSDPAAFANLPGVGPYTTAAVLSIAFGADLASDIRILNTDDKTATGVSGKEPVEQGSPYISHMGITGGAGCKAYSNWFVFTQR